MAEYDKGRLYWIKLTDRFISSDTVDFLMSQKEGANYVVLYQMLCLKTVNNRGVLARELGEMIVPYDVEKIQRDCKWFSIDTVRIALELYKKLGLIYENNDGILAITNFDRLIGSQTYGAEKKALQRQRKDDNLLQGGQEEDICPPDKEKEKEIEIYKDKEKEKNLKKEILTTTTTTETHACEDKIPLVLEVARYFENTDPRFNTKAEAYAEANKFHAYNSMMGWKCLPDWQKAADLWLARIDDKR